MNLDAQFSGGRLTRPTVLTLLDTAISHKELRFARRAALAWLAQFPGDLQVALLYGKALYELAQYGDAARALQRLLARDPEYMEGLALAHKALEQVDPTAAQFYSAWQYALGRQSPGMSIPAWAGALRTARTALQDGDVAQAESQFLEALTYEPDTPLLAVTHLQILQAQAEKFAQASNHASIKIAEHYAGLWKDCVQVHLLLARAYFGAARSDQAVALLHQVAGMDAGGQVIRRFWGDDHPYQGLWPETLTGRLSIPVPAAVSNALGWNQLTDGGSGGSTDLNATPESDASATEELPYEEVAPTEALHDTQVELERIAAKLKRPEIAASDGRYPVYVVLSTRQGLIDQYGAQGYSSIREAMEKLRQAVDARPNWRAITFMADEPASTAASGVKPVRASDPWAIKLSLAELDEHLKHRGEMLGAVLIVGGPRVVPFHHLPNPVDDIDLNVPSDNPYGTRDENFFVTEWPVGRLPGDDSDDPVPLLKALQVATKNHIGEDPDEPWYLRWWHRLIHWLFRTRRLPGPAFGYTAAIWKRAAHAVFQPIGNSAALIVSPPADTAKYRRLGHLPSGWGYFNLHGIPDAPDWFGHNDPTSPLPGPDYPVALRPEDIDQGNLSFDIIFSEACYGALICEKRVPDSMALTMLTSGVRSFIGSTSTAYGSISTPLIAADLLAHAFWKLARQDVPVGEALRRAKIGFIHDMDSRQGYLDGEDQKTLISFILYGDPLARPFSKRKLAKDIYRPLTIPDVQTTCDRDGRQQTEQLNERVQAKVKKVVQQYLPGMLDAEVSVNTVRYACEGEGHNCPTAQMHVKSSTAAGMGRQVVVLSKQVKKTTQTHYQYARLTLDANGKVIKLAVSR
jgi:tetratricopeptide (TPR) repeat protein